MASGFGLWAHVHDSASLLQLGGMWFGMMALMMAPTAAPWVAAFRQAVDPSALASAMFWSGYSTAWLGYSSAAALAQWGLQRAGALDPIAGVAEGLGAAVLIAAGVYQFAPVKRACLTHCRNPFSFFLARWRGGPAGGFRLGLGHGLYCVGCCWALMATTLAVGMASVWWMAVLAAVVFVEQVVPRGDRLRVPFGFALVAGGVLRMWP